MDKSQSQVLPADTFDQQLERLTGLPDGAHTSPSLVQSADFYGNVTQHIVQTVRTEDGAYAFITAIGATGTVRMVLPPKVTAALDRQKDAVTAKLRRRQGKRLAEAAAASGRTPGFTPEQRAKALATRKAKAAAKRKRRA